MDFDLTKAVTSVNLGLAAANKAGGGAAARLLAKGRARLREIDSDIGQPTSVLGERLIPAGLLGFGRRVLQEELS